METLNRSTPPEFKTVESINIIQPHETRFRNGIPVHIINADIQDIVEINFIFNSGHWYQSAPLIASTASGLINEGTHQHTSAELAELMDYYGSFFQQSTNQHTSELVLYSLGKYLPQTIELVEEMIKSPVYPQEKFDIVVTNRKQGFVIDQEKVESKARKKLMQSLFGDRHPYGISAELEDFDRLTVEQVREFHQLYYTSKNCTIVLAGRITDETVELVEKHFGLEHWNVNEMERPEVEAIEQPSEQKKVFIEKTDALQSAIRIGKKMVNRNHPDYPGLYVLNTILGGYFGSRLMNNVREEKGYTYGIDSVLISQLEAGYMVIISEVGADVCSLALKEIYAEIERLKHELVPLEELETVKNVLLGEMLREFDGPFSLSAKLKTSLLYSSDFSYYTEFIQSIRNIQPEQLLELANKYYKIDEFFEVVAGRM